MFEQFERENVIEVPKEMGNLTIGYEDDASPPAPEQESAAPAQRDESGPIYLGGKRFESKEDLIAYTQELQTKVTRQDIEREYSHPASPALQGANHPKPGDLLYQDPNAFYELVKEDAKKEVLGQIRNENAQQRSWQTFYSKFPDLKDHAEMVEFQFEKRKKEMGHLPADQVLDTVGKDVRAIFGKIKGRPEGGKELPSGSAVVASSTNNIPSSKAAAQSEPNDMASQIRRFQKRGR